MIQSHDPQYNKELQNIVNSIKVERISDNQIMINRGNKSIIEQNQNTELKDILADLADGFQNPQLDYDETNNVVLKTIFTADEIDTFPLSG